MSCWFCLCWAAESRTAKIAAASKWNWSCASVLLFSVRHVGKRDVCLICLCSKIFFFLNVGCLKVGGVVLDKMLVGSVQGVYGGWVFFFKMCFVNYIIATRAWVEDSDLWVLGAEDRPGRGNSPSPLGCEAFRCCAKKSFVCLVASVFKMKASFKVMSSAIILWRL